MLRKAILAVSLVLGFYSICSSFAADAPEPGKVWRIGYLGNSPPTTPEVARIWDAFRQELQERGYVEGRNLVFEMRFLEGKPERAPGFAAELVRLRMDLIVAAANPAAVAAKAATSTIPIVVVAVADPVGVGLIPNLARPGGNITGVADYSADLVPKRLELLKEALPTASRVAFIRCMKCFARYDPASTWAATAQSLGMTLADVDLGGPQDLDSAMAAVLRVRPDALFVGGIVTWTLRRELADFAIRERLAMFAFAREQAILGSLMAYGVSYSDAFRKAAAYVDKILKGAKPADLPVEQPTKFELVINLQTAKALGITIPQSLVLRADEVIQ
jgi:putative ABC transport system substrate-binding protein